MESYRKLEEVRRYSNKELKVSRDLIEAVRGQKEFATLGRLKSFQYVSGIPGMAYNPFVNEEARKHTSTTSKSQCSTSGLNELRRSEC